MCEEEYAQWKKGSLEYFAKSLLEAGKCSEGEAKERAEAALKRTMNGLTPENNQLLIAENEDGAPIGMIWYETKDPSRAYIRDFLVYETYRRMGYGYAILNEAERIIRLSETPAIVLHVFEHNTSAIRLYEKCGYSIEKAAGGSLGMKKELE